MLHPICQEIWKTHEWPQDWKSSVLFHSQIIMPKKVQMSIQLHLLHIASKVMLKIHQVRLQQYLNWEVADAQSGFWRGRGTRDHIGNICWIMMKAKVFQKNIYFCFIDCTKAFDCVDQNKLKNSEEQFTCLLRNLYVGQETTIRNGHGTINWFKIGKGVRQGCILSPCLFNFYEEKTWNTRLDESQVGIKIFGWNINNIRYEDFTNLVAVSEEVLKTLLKREKEESEKSGLKLI